MRFGEHLKQARLSQQLTQKDVAEQLHVSRQTISSWETEHSYPDIDSLLRLSDFYGLSLDTLLREDTGMTDYLRRQDVRQQIRPVRITLTLMTLGFALLVVLDQLMPRLNLINPMVSFIALFGIIALDYVNHFNRHLRLDTRPLFRDRYPWFDHYAQFGFGFLAVLGFGGSLLNISTWLTVPIAIIGFAGCCFWLIAHLEKA
ncbi:helix-turn-helix domain-containing protein [Lactiplantibacillus daowaiensis]|uniref:Helix-turn-helix domain-containing protein n=1 Tax=Lactiplantibacillus daowaiensis TaxID=2559918 RepID=A0ABW1S093_9LACO|nr:helix-turn-helix transcriptional regulator [Lactiplantibacillus daowaiensis]